MPPSRRTLIEYVYVLTAMMRKTEPATRNSSMPNVGELRALLREQRRVIHAMAQYTRGHAYGLLDSDHDDLMSEGWYHTFEMETLLTMPRLAPADLQHIFHQIERRMTGIPTMIEMDEATLPMAIPDYAETLPAWLMTKRKQNASIILSTPLVTLIEKPALRTLLLQYCPTCYFTPNPAALEDDVAAVYRGMGCNEEIIKDIATMRLGEYWYMSELGKRRFQLNLGGLLSVFCGSRNSPQDQVEIDAMLAQHGPQGFAAARLRAHGYPDAAAQLEEDFCRAEGRDLSSVAD